MRPVVVAVPLSEGGTNGRRTRAELHGDTQGRRGIFCSVARHYCGQITFSSTECSGSIGDEGKAMCIKEVTGSDSIARETTRAEHTGKDVRIYRNHCRSGRCIGAKRGCHGCRRRRCIAIEIQGAGSVCRSCLATRRWKQFEIVGCCIGNGDTRLKPGSIRDIREQERCRASCNCRRCERCHGGWGESRNRTRRSSKRRRRSVTDQCSTRRLCCGVCGERSPRPERSKICRTGRARRACDGRNVNGSSDTGNRSNRHIGGRVLTPVPPTVVPVAVRVVVLPAP